MKSIHSVPTDVFFCKIIFVIKLFKLSDEWINEIGKSCVIADEKDDQKFGAQTPDNYAVIIFVGIFIINLY